MKRKLLVLLVLSSCLYACGKTSANPTPEMSGQNDALRPVSASGRVIPQHWAAPGFGQGGQVVTVGVEEGQYVAAGHELAFLDDTEAQLALRAAQQALSARKASLALAEATRWPSDVAAAQAVLRAAQEALRALRDAPTERDLEEARLAVEQAKNTLWATQLEGSIPGLPISAQEAARARAAVAEQAVALAQSKYARVKEGASTEAEASTVAAVAQAQASLDRLQRGAGSEELEILRAQIRSAEVVVEQAVWAISLCKLRSPLSGTVTAMALRPGEFVMAGTPVLTVADLSILRIETTDLDEADLSRVKVGQVVEVTLDAIPGEVLLGRVTRIADMSQTSQGGSSFAVVIEFDKPDSRLRWGMTAFVDIVAE
jgi:HlyD family secretion protein